MVFQLRHIACIFCINNFLDGIAMTYDEFCNLVKEELSAYLESFDLTDKDIAEYMKRNDDLLFARYDKEMSLVEQGRRTLDEVKFSAVDDVASTLSDMFE